MTGKLSGKVAVITGAGSGIGRAAAELFAREGAEVALVDLNAQAAAAAAEQITDAGGRALAVGADVADAAQVDLAFRQISGEFGRIDVLYNNAGVNSAGSVVTPPTRTGTGASRSTPRARSCARGRPGG